jgi:hypothetical protein
VPRNQDPGSAISDWVPKLLRGIAQQLSGEAASMTFGGVDCQGLFNIRRKVLGRKDGMLPVDSVHSDDR